MIKLKAVPISTARKNDSAASYKSRRVAESVSQRRSWNANNSRQSVRSFKRIICVDISEFESSHPSHAVGSLWCVYPVHRLCEQLGAKRSGQAGNVASLVAPSSRPRGGQLGLRAEASLLVRAGDKTNCGRRTAPHLDRRGQGQQLRRRHFGGRGFSF